MLYILLPSKTIQRMCRPPENRLPRDIYMKIIIISTRLFIIFPNLITKESYNWWVTRRVWGFRYQISKAKYLKISVANIGKLQENTAALYKISTKLSE